ncbi:NAD-dependent epimerase/dehydratase family protein [Vibrio parahaemolyticus]|nr:NAD-dependent epimerase/dehydratase family protein [Vibrio parahaemolyticus]EJG2032355.1 NAD-dependent epimerase/dehydratase family protein [Vibrio parahaemolyticus]
MKNKKVLIIGSYGFIGTHLKNYLELKGFDVWGCDINVTEGVKYFRINTERPTFGSIFSNIFDICINCSGAANVAASVEEPRKDFYLNTVNVFEILEAIHRESPNCKFINLSSAAVYGNPKSLPVREIDNRGPVSPYGWHKLQAEDICTAFHDLFGIQTISLRIFSAYGEGLKKQLLWDIFNKSRHSDYIEFWGTGNETRDFIYIRDLVHAIYLVINNAVFNGGYINVANGTEVSIKDVVNLVLKELDWKGEHKFIGQERAGDPSKWVADITRLKDLGYEQSVGFDSGVRKYCKWLM